MLYLSSHAACGPCADSKPHDETVSPEPISFYGISKKNAEDVIQKSGLNYVIVRPVAVYGPYDTETLKYFRLINNRFCPIIGYGEKYLNLIYVQDLVCLIGNILGKRRFDNTVHFAHDGHCYSFTEIAAEIERALNRRSVTLHVPQSVATFYGLLNDVFLAQHKRLVWRDKVRELAQQHWLCSTETVRAAYGFKPRFTLRQGMTSTIAWYKDHGLM
jgi:nucleoside-diphosphate-sugar epimerase